jgi:hypothetical protein
MTHAAPPGTIRYWARAVPGGLQRHVVYKFDPTRKLCLALTVVNHALRGLAVDVTPPWKVESETASWNAADCETRATPPPDARARAASGTIGLRADGDRCLIDLDVMVTFDPKPPHLRSEEAMAAHGVAIASARPPCM